MRIRPETSKDYEEVYSVVKAAFQSAEHSDGCEQDLVTALRKSHAFVPELSLVAENEGKIVGHIMYTEAEINGHKVLVLAPLSILPDSQKQGIGTALMKEGHRIAKELGYGYCVVLGSETYYPKAGYIPAIQLGIEAPFSVPLENFMALKLDKDAEPLCGVLIYPPEFGI